MRRFIKTFTVKKFTQFTVVQDGERKVFLVLRWDAGGRGPVEIGDPMPYESEQRGSVDDARSRAISMARRLAAEAQQSRALGEPPAPLSAEEAADEDARAAARAQRLSPNEQEAAFRRRL